MSTRGAIALRSRFSPRLSPRRGDRRSAPRHAGRPIFLAACTALFLLAPAGPASARDRVIVLGFDGADSRLTEAWMNEGRLPNLARLRDLGAYRPLMPTNPPQTPVSWAAFSTGLDPGTNEIFDFLKRIPGTYYPDYAVASEGRQRFLLGDKNPILAAAVCLVATYVVFAGITALFGLRRRTLALAPLIPAAIAGAVGLFVGAQYLPEEVPKAINNRKGLTFWSYAADQGVKTRTIRVPNTFPAEPVAGGTFLSGLGVPDIRGRIGTPSLYTSEPIDEDEYNDFSVEVISIPRRGKTVTEVFGPRNLLFYTYKIDKAVAAAQKKGEDTDLARRRAEERLRKRGVPPIIKVPLELEITDDRLQLELPGEKLSLRVGEWSDWLHITFPFNPLVKARGIARFKLLALDPEVRLYFSPVNLDPEAIPAFTPITHPREFARELARDIGPYKTMGWAIDTWSIQEERIDEQTFLEDVDETIRQFEAMFNKFIDDESVELYTQIFYFTDRVQHILWRLRDPEHPKYDPEKSAEFEHAIFDSYKKMDEIVGKAMTKIDDRTHLIVVSDHGFSTWRRAMNLNTWLARNGFMTLTGEGEEKDLEALFDRGSFWPNIDWSRTKAFALGLGYIYINLLGREPEGTVLPGAEYERVCQEIARGLEAFVDPKTGLHPVTNVYHRRDIYHPGFDEDLIPDLRVCNSEGYRVSWQSSLGATPAEILYDVDKNWSADHCSLEPEIVKGVYFSSFPVDSEDPWVADIFPTICKLLELEVPPGLHGQSLID